jgi:predicted DNA-binding transcriptional regulator AlpA
MVTVNYAGVTRKAQSGKLPLLRFQDLRASGIVKTWATLNAWVDERGFPPGRMIGRFRTWTEAEVMAWVESQSTCRIEPRGIAKANRDSNGGAA